VKQFEKNIHSQFGEDGILEELFRLIGVRWSTCIEFGAWDGLHLSNTLHLWRSLGWKALLIEGDPKKYRDLLKSTAGHPQAHSLNRMVTPSGAGRIENLIEESGFPKDIDLLSIDIDGDDIYILESLKTIRPRVIVVEYNPTIPAHLDVRQSCGEYFGASALALHKVARTKGYRLAHATQVNLFFVHESEFAKLGFPEPELRDVVPRDHVTYLITSYNGTAFLSQVPAYFPITSIEDPTLDGSVKPIPLGPTPVRFPELAKEGDSLVKAEVKIKKEYR
jgi:hypothetical protein